MHRATILLLFVSSAGCARRGELRYHYDLDPPATSNASAYRVRVERVSGVNMVGARHRAVPRLWVELKVENRSKSAWELRAADLHMLPDDREATGFAEYPNIRPAAPVEAAVTVEAGQAARVWVRFDEVHTQQAVASRAGVDAPIPLSLRVRSPVAAMTLTLSDPLHGEPIWTPTEWPYFATLSFGTGVTGGRDDLQEDAQAAMSLDVSMSALRRFGEFDLGLVGLLRAGIEAHPVKDGAYSFYGGGLTTGYTTHFGSFMYMRPALGVVVGRTGHPLFDTTPAWLFGELQFGMPRRSTYPYRERRTNFTLGWYLRGQARLTSLSDAKEAHSFGMSFGLVMRGGS